ncbi:vascular cell adhesion protein 1-like isoform X1 [Sander vitreus]
MFFRFILLVVSLMGFLHSFHMSICGQTCVDKPVFTPTRLVVKHGDPTSASCSVCQHACLVNGTKSDLEKNIGDTSINGTTILWTVKRLTEWQPSPICYYSNSAYQCCSTLNVTVYQPPDSVSISFVNHTGPMLEGHQYTLQCTVQDVAPVDHLIVTFYRGQTALGQLQSNNTEKKPVTEIFSLNITPSKEDDGGRFWCEAKLKLGPDGPQLPPVVTSENITATVHYKPQLKSSHSDLITVAEGNSLQLNCSAVGNPSPLYTWKSPIHSYSNGSVLTIDSVTSADKGQYTCSVSNHVGTATVTFNVDVEGLKSTSTRLPPTTTTSTTTTTQKTTVPNCSTSSILLHRSMCFVLLFSALV